jgi:hypothetical protein
MTLEQSQRTLARARAKAHKTVDDFPLVTITGVSNRLELRRVTGLLGAESVFVDVTGVTEDLTDDDLIRVWPQPDKAGIYKFHSFVKRSGTNTVGDVFVPNLQTNLVKGPHGFAIEVFDAINQPGIGHQSKLEWSQASGVWRIHAANDGTAAGLDVQKGNISLAAGYTVDGVDVSGLDDDAIKKTLVDAKGDLIVATADDTVTRLAAGGTDGAVLIESSAASTGLAWSTQLKLAATETVINDAGADVDFRVEGDTDANLIVANAGLDVVAIGGAAVSGQKLTVYTGAVGVVGLVIGAAAGQTADILRVIDASWQAILAVEPGAGGAVKMQTFDAGTTNTAFPFKAGHRTSGTPAADFGTGFIFQSDSTTTEAVNTGSILSRWIDPTHATRKARLQLITYDTTTRVGLEIRTDGANAIVAIGGGTAQANVTTFIQAQGAAYKPLVLKGAASQTADLAQLQTSAAAVRRAWNKDGLDLLMADQTTDTAPNDDTTLKKLTLQKLAAPPTNAAYFEAQNNPGTDKFYLVIEEG